MRTQSNSSASASSGPGSVENRSAPVLDADRNLLAALIAMGPTARIDENDAAIVEARVAEAHALSVAVGALDPVDPSGVVAA